jgi:hypothetical protein
MQVVHETVIKDIVDILSDLKDNKSLENLLKNSKRGGMKSIAQASSNLTLTYPCLVSNSLSIDSVSMISKAMERKNAQMIQMLLSAYQSKKLNGDEEFDPIKYLQKFHKNLNIDYNVSVDSILDTVDKVVKLAESAGMYVDTVQYIPESQQIKYIKEQSKQDNTLPDMISESSVASYKISKNNMFGKTVVLQERTDYTNGLGFNDNRNDPTLLNPTVTRDGIEDVAKGDDEFLSIAKDYWNVQNAMNKNKYDTNKERREAEKHEFEKQKNNREVERNNRERQKHGLGITVDKAKYLNTSQQTAQGRIAQLQNVDVKKANELVGTPIMVTVHVTNKEGLLDPISFLIAVKSKIYPLDSKDIIQRVITKNKDKNFFGKIVKVATGEISFVRDFLFAIDQAKLDSLSQSRKGNSSKLWRVLERMAMKSKFSRAIGKQNEYMAITTLVMSQEEVEYIKKYANMDMEKEAIAKVIVDAYNLLCLVIVDETNETAKFLFNSDQELFEELSFNQLEREATDGSYRKMVNLITKMR